MKAKILLPLLSLTLGALPLLAELKYFPKDKEQLTSLIADESIKLDEIDTSKITEWKECLVRLEGLINHLILEMCLIWKNGL